MAKKTGEKGNSKKRNTNAMDFETSLQQLELIVAHLEDGNLGLSESLVQYEQGVKHLKHCYDLLQQTEQRIEILSGIDSEGRPLTKPFEASDAAEETRTETRSRPASRQTDAPNDDVDDQASLF